MKHSNYTILLACRQVLFLVAILFLSCQSSDFSTPMPNPTDSVSTQPGDELTFLSLGDSYTIGESVAEKDRWSVQLAGLLREKGVKIKDPDIIARTGWTTAELAESIRANENSKTYDLVSLLIGVNNQYRQQSTERYRTELENLLQTAIRYAKGNRRRVVVLSIPDWGVTPFAKDLDRTKIAAEIDTFNAVCKEECEKASVVYVDITPASRNAAGDKSLVASDDLHFSGKMYGQWASQVLPVVETMVK